MTSAVAFAYHNVGARCLPMLLKHQVDVKLVVTHEYTPGEAIWFDSVKALAQSRGLPVITPADPNAPDIVERIRALAPDFFFSFYYRSMLKEPLLGIPRRGAFNMHGSLLPRYRGRVPINWAILKGETETGVTLHTMTVKPDAGDIVAQTPVPIGPDETAHEVFVKVTVAAEATLDRVLPRLLAGTAMLTRQDLAKGSYFGGRKPEDGRIDWRAPARDIHNLVRAVTRPYPGAFCETAAGRVFVWRTRRTDRREAGAPQLRLENGALVARCGDGVLLQVLEAELNGEKLAALKAPLALT